MDLPVPPLRNPIHLTPSGRYASGDWRRCGFCRRLEAIFMTGLPDAQQGAAIDALFDLADRAAHARQVYGRRRRRR
jgi:hypothetical protein